MGVRAGMERPEGLGKVVRAAVVPGPQEMRQCDTRIQD